MGGRSYEFDPENARPIARSRSKQDDYKESVAKDMDKKRREAGDEELHYGKKFSETEELYAAHRMERELEELAREDGALPEEGEERREAKGEGGHAEKKPTRQAIEDVTRGSPIGALPLSSEPPPRDRFSEITDDAQRYAQMIRDAVRDIGTAGLRLARLPVEAAILAARRFGPQRG